MAIEKMELVCINGSLDQLGNVFDKFKTTDIHLINIFEIRHNKGMEPLEDKSFIGSDGKRFYLAGWMSAGDAVDFEKALGDVDIAVTVKPAEEMPNLVPPTRLKNFVLFRPFEGLVKMYGTPSYGEADPTPLFAITYSLMFGLMCGDIGHGAVLAILGFILAKRKRFLGKILQICGFSALVFGFLYGSVFGYEEIHPLWYRPMENIMFTLIIAVAFGAVIISLSMAINIANGVRHRDLEKAFLSPNGVVGFIFYWAVIIAALRIVMGNSALKWWYIGLFVVVPLVLIFLKEPILKIIKKQKDILPKSKGMFLLERFFVLFEVLLSYVTNTISFIRIGAFALNHAGMMAVVFTLAEMVKGAGHIAIIAIGNAVVLVLEGGLAAIQVLRLQYYEMFSRYYEGKGVPFESYTENAKEG